MNNNGLFAPVDRLQRANTDQPLSRSIHLSTAEPARAYANFLRNRHNLAKRTTPSLPRVPARAKFSAERNCDGGRAVGHIHAALQSLRCAHQILVEVVVCRRYSRAKSAQAYLHPLYGERGLEDSKFPRSWNIAPGSIQPVIYRDGLKVVRWGFSPTSIGKKRPMMTHCRTDDRNAATWKTLWKIAPLIVPADGWYEWRHEGDNAQPYYIKPISDGPVYLAALSSVARDEEAQDTDGFVLLTSRIEAGLVDESSHRPVVLSASDAIRWLDLKTFGAAKRMLDESLLTRDLFLYYRVSVGVNSVGNDELAFNDPLPDDIRT